MSLKLDIEEYPHEWSKELVDAVEDYKNGKWNSKRKLRKFVNREISAHYYNELIERYRIHYNKNYDRRVNGLWWDVVTLIVVFGSMLCNIVYLIVHDQGNLAFWYFLLFCGVASNDKATKSREISRLTTENKILKERLKDRLL